MAHNTLVVIVGPTGVGKTNVSVEIAQQFGGDILSSDSRQIYRSMTIGTAAPDAATLERVSHHFIQFLDPHDLYNASVYESQVTALLPTLFKKNPVQFLVGGSMLYVDAVCKGIDVIPDVDLDIRANLKQKMETEGIESIRLQLKQLDPESFKTIDLKNPARLIHAVEVSLTTGKPYSSFLTRNSKSRDFNIIKIGLNLNREILYERINMRVRDMISVGLEDEVKNLLPYRECNALQTVGYKEMFAYLDGEYSINRAVELIQRNSRHYAKKQLTWFRKDESIRWFSPSQVDEIANYIQTQI